VASKMGLRSWCSSALASASSAVLEYDTPKIVHIKNKKVGFLNRVVQAAIFLYIIVYVGLSLVVD
jgi:P2X purinoceptor 4